MCYTKCYSGRMHYLTDHISSTSLYVQYLSEMAALDGESDLTEELVSYFFASERYL